MVQGWGIYELLYANLIGGLAPAGGGLGFADGGGVGFEVGGAIDFVSGRDILLTASGAVGMANGCGFSFSAPATNFSSWALNSWFSFLNLLSSSFWFFEDEPEPIFLISKGMNSSSSYIKINMLLFL